MRRWLASTKSTDRAWYADATSGSPPGADEFCTSEAALSSIRLKHGLPHELQGKPKSGVWAQYRLSGQACQTESSSAREPHQHCPPSCSLLLSLFPPCYRRRRLPV